MATHETIAAPEEGRHAQETTPTPGPERMKNPVVAIEVGIDASRVRTILPSACHGWALLQVDLGGRLWDENPDAPTYKWVHARLEDVAPLLWRE